MNAFEKVMRFITEKMAWIAMIAILACVALVVTDVIRYQAVGKPVPGTHEVVELIASVILSMGIGYLTFVKGHVAVGILVDTFRPRVQAVDVSTPDDIVLTFRGSETKVRLGGEAFGARAAEYLDSRDRWEKAFGPLESVLLGLPGRIVLQPRAEAGAKENI